MRREETGRDGWNIGTPQENAEGETNKRDDDEHQEANENVASFPPRAVTSVLVPPRGAADES